MSVTEAFPLQWPRGVPRSKYRVHSQFSQTVASAQEGLMRELDRLGATNVVITSDIGPRKKDGTLYANAKTQMANVRLSDGVESLEEAMAAYLRAKDGSDAVAKEGE